MQYSASDTVIRRYRAHEDMSQVSAMALASGSEEDEIEQMIRTDNIFIATKNERAVGFIALRDAKRLKSIEVTGLAIEKNERRKRLGESLLRCAEEFARCLNARKLIVKTTNDNSPALKLYHKQGYVVHQVRRGAMIRHHKGREVLGWNGTPVSDEVVLEKKL